MTDPAATLALLREIEQAIDDGLFHDWDRLRFVKLRVRVRRLAKRMEAETP